MRAMSWGCRHVSRGCQGLGVSVRLLHFLHLLKDRNPCYAHFCGILLILTTITNVKTVGSGAKKHSSQPQYMSMGVSRAPESLCLGSGLKLYEGRAWAPSYIGLCPSPSHSSSVLPVSLPLKKPWSDWLKTFHASLLPSGSSSQVS